MPPHTHTPSLVFQPIRRPIQWTASAHLFLKVIPPLEGQVHVSRQLSLICMSYYPKKGPCTRCHLILFICTTYRTVTHSLTWQLYGGLGDSLWQTSRSQKRTTPSYIGAVPCVQHSWHCHKKAHCPVTYGKDSGFRINTADAPPTELPSVARLITHTETRQVLLSNSSLVPLCPTFGHQVLCEHFLVTCWTSVYSSRIGHRG